MATVTRRRAGFERWQYTRPDCDVTVTRTVGRDADADVGEAQRRDDRLHIVDATTQPRQQISSVGELHRRPSHSGIISVVARRKAAVICLPTFCRHDKSYAQLICIRLVSEIWPENLTVINKQYSIDLNISLCNIHRLFVEKGIYT